MSDPQIFVEVSDDEMQAKITVLPPEAAGAPALSLDRVRAALAENGVTFGINEDELKKIEPQILAMTDHSKSYTPVEVIAARGNPVVHGTDAYLEKYYDKKKEEPKAAVPGAAPAAENKNARVDYRDLNVIENVEKGTVLCKLIPCTQGQLGTTILGKEVIPAEGKDMVIKAGAGVALDQANPNIFIAMETGQVVIKNETISVLAIYEINGDLTMKIGNVDFLGTVLIHGSVNGEFKVKAGADVVIDGVLDGGEVIAGGKVTVKGGIIGAKTRVTAEGEINAKYVRNAYVESGSIISIVDTSMHSTLIASEKVIFTGRGMLVGGTTVAGWEVNAKEIGARSNTPTDVEVGEDPRMRDEMRRIESEAKALNEQLDKAKKGIHFLKELTTKMGGKLPDDKKEMLNKLTRTQFKLLGDLKVLHTRKSEIENKEQEAKTTGKKRAKVGCQGLIYPGTKITVSRVSKAITQEVKFTTFVEDNGQVKSNPYG